MDSKLRISQNLNEEDFFVYCSDDEITIRELEKIVMKAKQLGFTLKETRQPGAYIEGDMMKIEVDDEQFEMSLAELALKGKHNVYNSMAAGIAGSVLKIRKPVIRESLMDFTGVEHRLEQFIKVHGIDFINDSKATNVNSTWYALESMTTPVIWIAGRNRQGK